MVTKPGQASKIITMPETASDATAETAKTPDATASATTPEGAATADQEDAAATVPDLPAAASDLAATPPVVAGDATTSGEQQVAAAEQTAADPSAATPAEAIDQAEQKRAVGAPEVLVSAVELEGDRIFIAGNARPGAMVRVYADDQIVAEARADETGRFVADGTIRLAVGNHTIRADVLSADGKKVEFRASVPFFRPEGDLAAVASNDAAADAPAIEPLANGTFDKARDEARKSVELLKGLYAAGKTPTVEELAAARSSAEIALKSLAEVHVPADVDPALAEMAATASREAGKALDRLKAVPADVAAFQSALGEVETIVGAAVKPAAKVASANDAARTAQSEAATTGDDTVDKSGEPVSADDVQVTAKVERLEKSAVAGDQAAVETPDVAGSQAASQETASADEPKVIEQAPLKKSEGSVIIRRGDTLWQISRRVYGMGVRYTTIYVANKGQIDDPDRIMPGQIFSMPGKWLDNAEQIHKERMQHDQ
ncbi:MAG: LysM peptidoglycan-binding domain-containing protein [Rhizobium sp.]|nr:LysM peptidoglycan-binding domain-containing protein [Rhizobium sp.]